MRLAETAIAVAESMKQQNWRKTGGLSGWRSAFMGVVALARVESYPGGLSGFTLNNECSESLTVCRQRHQLGRHGSGNAIGARLNCGLEAGEVGVAH